MEIPQNPSPSDKVDPAQTPRDKTEMTKREEIILSLIITACIVVIVSGIVWATHQGSSQTKTGAPQTQQQMLQYEQSGMPIGGPAVLDQEWTRFGDSGGRFTIDTPDIARVIADKASMSAVSYLPTCNPDTGIVCIYLPDTTFPKTNFNGAGVSVNVTSDNTTSCLEMKNGEMASTSEKIIGSIPFVSYTASDAAMSHQSTGNDYRAFYNGTCYEITTRINTSTFEVYTDGSISRYTDQERTTTGLILEKIVSSFRFLK